MYLRRSWVKSGRVPILVGCSQLCLVVLVWIAQDGHSAPVGGTTCGKIGIYFSQSFAFFSERVGFASLGRVKGRSRCCGWKVYSTDD